MVSEQGKAPDFVLEVASESTGDADLKEKRDFYEFVGVLEYWRFDETGEYHGTRLAGERLVEGEYRPIPIEERDDGILQGYSAALGLGLRWQGGQLAFCDADTGQPIATLADERNRADGAEAQRVSAEARADAARNRAAAAEARVRELEAELRRRDADNPV